MSPFLFSVAVVAGVIASQIVSLILQSYLPAYAKEKGKNLATHEDIQKLVDQVKAVTQATKKIEAEISSGVWDRQKRWELRRDTLFEVAKRLAELQDALTKLYSVASVGATYDLSGASDLVLAWQRSWNEALQGFSKADDEFNQDKLLTAIVSSKHVALALSEFGGLCGRVASGLAKNDRSMYDTTQKERSTAMLRVLKAMRDDLGIEAELPTVQLS
jgi:hypothetical protein